ncbi:eukaryotic translation initiation factor 4E-2-like [Sipha flava]|uniref:Eukaryotic translation initiation factor 4E-2-like n=1 Tax=Sipha flava TaxID=143950 RepID=A0A8B8GRI8_9HEMI|nr:eukaryotic translation initiation factor 4E-2-like [Sipha flava]
MDGRGTAVPLPGRWTWWYKDPCANNENWTSRLQELFDVKTSAEYATAYGAAKLPSALAPGAGYYVFRHRVWPAWEAEPNRGAGAWTATIEPARGDASAAVDFAWSDLLFLLVSEGFGQLSGYVCGVTCSAKPRGRHKVGVWTVRTTAANHRYILMVGRLLGTVLRNACGATVPIAYKPHEGTRDSFDYAIS